MLIYMSACIHGSQRGKLGVLLCHSLPCCFEIGSVTEPGASLTANKLQAIGLQAFTTPCSAFFFFFFFSMGPADLNLGLQTCTITTTRSHHEFIQG